MYPGLKLNALFKSKSRSLPGKEELNDKERRVI